LSPPPAALTQSASQQPAGKMLRSAHADAIPEVAEA
jgi:hypothetical protein